MKYQSRLKLTSWATLFNFALGLLIMPAQLSPTLARADATPTPSSIPIAADDTQCGNICNSIPDPSKSITSHGSPWNTNDTRLCAGLIINPNDSVCTVNIRPEVASLAAQVDAGDINSGITNTKGASADCKKAMGILQACQNHANPSQLSQQCAAYKASNDQNIVNGIPALIGVGSAATAACWIACFQGPLWEAACGALSMAGGSLEIDISTKIRENSAVSDYLKGATVLGIPPEAFIGLGSAEAAAGLYMGARGGSRAATRSNSKDSTPARDYGAEPPEKNPWKETDTPDRDSSSRKANKGGKSSNKLACATAVLETTMIGIRSASLDNILRGRDESCNTIRSLAYTGGTLGGGTGGGSYTGSAAAVASDASDTSGSGRRTPQQALDRLMSCASSGTAMSTCIANNGNQLSSAAAGVIDPFFSNPNSLSQLKDNLPNLDRVMGAAKTGGAGSAMNAAMPGGMGSGPTAAEMKGLIDTIGKEVKNFGPIPGLRGTYSGGGARGSSGSNSDPGFAALLNFGQNRTPGSASASTNLLNFKAGLDAKIEVGADIWHSGFKGSIFQIVSVRTAKSLPQLTDLEWSTPLNRAAHGLRNNLSSTPTSKGAHSQGSSTLLKNSLHPLILPK